MRRQASEGKRIEGAIHTLAVRLDERKQLFSDSSHGFEQFLSRSLFVSFDDGRDGAVEKAEGLVDVVQVLFNGEIRL